MYVTYPSLLSDKLKHQNGHKTHQSYTVSDKLCIINFAEDHLISHLHKTLQRTQLLTKCYEKYETPLNK